MKEKNTNDILIVSESRPIKSQSQTPVSSVGNLKIKTEINPKHLTYNKLIGQRAKYNKNELLIISEKDATFTIISERPANYGNNGDESSNSGKLCGNNCCGLFGNSSSAYGGNSNKEMCYNIITFITFIIMVIFPPVGILLLFLVHICTKNV